MEKEKVKKGYEKEGEIRMRQQYKCYKRVGTSVAHADLT